VYGPNREFADDVLRRFGIDVEYYPPLAGADIEHLVRPNTRLVWCESPGSVTMEVQDVPAIAAVAHHHGIIVAIDNTYSAGVYFDAFAHGADVTMQALTKYIGGHSDLLLGSVTVKTVEEYERLGVVHGHLGLALRGLQTLGVRLRALERSALHVAQWLSECRAISSVLHPALTSCQGHELWKRDFTGSASVFSIVFAEGTTHEAILAFVDALALFKVGYSWGGVTSLAMPWSNLRRTHGTPYGGRVVRLNIGLEDVDDLVTDLDQALHRAGLAGS
jgi:cystathionine beta-lyase